MAEVITFENFRPPARFDAKPWTGVNIEESADGSTGWTQIDHVTLAPDADPENPELRSFTTEKGTALGYWYRVIFTDATGDLAQPTTPIQNLAGSGVAPHAYATVADLQRVLQKPSPTAAEAEAMQRVLYEAALKIDLYLGYTTDNPAPVDGSFDFYTLREVNLGMSQELWSMEGRVAGIIPVGPDSVPVISAQNIWNRWRLRLLPLKMNGWGVA